MARADRRRKNAELIEQAMTPILDRLSKIITRHEFTADGVQDEQTAEALKFLHNRMVLVLRSLWEMHSAYEDTLIVYRMAGSYPWREKIIRRSDHLRIIWFNHVNLCYLLREKTALFANTLKAIHGALKEKYQIDLKSYLRRIDASLGKHIRARGQIFHEWYEENSTVRYYKAIEIISRTQPSFLKGPIIDHYRDAKMMMRWDIKSSLEFMEKFVLDVIEDHKKQIVYLIDLFVDLYAKAKGPSRTVTLSLSKAK